MNIEIYTKENINKLKWPKNKLSIETKNYFLPLINNPINQYIKNVETEIGIIKHGNLILPFTLNDTQYENSYVCSPYGQYIKYAKEELYLIENKLLKNSLKLILSLLSKIFKFGKINKTIIINNWLLSTNLYPKNIDKKTISSIKKHILKLYPNHTIMFKSLNKYFYKNIYSNLSKAGFNFIGSRQIYVYNPKKELNRKDNKKLRKELKLLDDKLYSYPIPKNNEKIISDIYKLYTGLYIKKYSKLNPQLTKKFIESTLSNDLVRYNILVNKKTDETLGIVGYFVRDKVMTTPILGYSLKKNKKNKIYRRLSMKLAEISNKNNYLFNRSSGVSKFKISRGAFSEMEYNAVYYKHLPVYRTIPWIILEKIINGIGIKLLEKYEL